jgi:transcriptional regulator with XRE-family HTH domain
MRTPAITDLNEIFRANVKGRREQLGITQTTAARRAGLSQAYWSQLESGVRLPSLATLPSIAGALSTTPEFLFVSGVFSADRP